MGEQTGERQGERSADGQEEKAFPIVGIGASAGGLVALEHFFEGVPSEPGMAFVVVQHLSPDHESGLVHLLSGYTPLVVRQAEDGMAVEPDHVYVIPPDSQLALQEGCLRVSARPKPERMPVTIDDFLRTLAEERGARAACVILSGTGTDGTLGLQAIKQKGGFVLVQEESDADYGGMPQSAAKTGFADIVAPADELASRLVDIFGPPDSSPVSDPETQFADEQERGLVEILRLLRLRTGGDFGLYKRATVLRRISRRMQVCHCKDLSSYLTYLEEHGEEIRLLYRELLISVTNFFRDREVWKRVEAEVVPRIFEGKGPQDEVRVWVAGCATGEEAYTVGMLLREYCDQLEAPPELKVFATDINPEVIERARQGVYPRQIAADIPSDRLRRFFVEEGEGYRVVKELRNDILFAAQNALEDPPFSDLDFVSCRNLLIYLKSRAQKRLLETFHYALRPEGQLLLGCSETVSAASGLFSPVDGQHRIYESMPIEQPRSFVPRTDWATGLVEPSHRPDREPLVSDEEAHRQLMLEHYVPPSVLLDRDYEILHVHGRLDPYVRISEGRPTRNLLDMLHGQLRPQLQTMLFRVAQKDCDLLERRLTLGEEEDHRQVLVQVHRYDREGGRALLEVSFQRLEESAESADGSDVDETMQPIVEQLQRELEDVRARLRVTIEEYESANEELKASNEELLSMNEELQSTTEELETSKEELQSMNEELTTVNEELNGKIEQLDAVNNDLTNLLSSTEIGTVFLDRNFRVKRYTKPVADYLHLLPADRGRPIDHVTHDLESESLLADAKRSLADLEVIEREVRSEDGRWFLVRTLPYRTLDDRIDGVVITFIDMTRRKEAERRLAESEKRFRTFFDSASDAMFVYEIEGETVGTFQEVNGSAVEMLGLSSSELREMTLADILADEGFSVAEHVARLTEERWAREETTLRGPGRRSIPVEIHARLFEHEAHTGVVAAVRDMTQHKKYEKVLIDAKEKAEELAELRSMFLSTMSHEVRSPLTAILSYAEVLSRQVDGEASESVERIRQSGERLRESLDTVLQMARMESKEIEPNLQRFELGEVVAKTVELRRRQAEQKGLEVEVTGTDQPLEVELDEQFVRQILGNLIDNAIKYTDEGYVRVGMEIAEEEVSLVVADSGLGISEEEQEQVFERFARGQGGRSAGKPGVGLGLSIVGLLVEALGGEIELESAAGEGSVFRVCLPRRRRDEGSAK